MHGSRLGLLGVGLVVLAGAACAASSTSAPRGVVVWVDGDSQTAVVGQPLPKAIGVQVVADGSPLPGVMVGWTVTAGGGSVSADSTPTDSAGSSTVTWTLGPVQGRNAVRARVGRWATVDFTATAVGAPVSAVPSR